ncbi:uncharacterized protein LOC129764839 [Toxorhynchites rutilus septentrionalis]|uniref:uncharacterized protein LOC129764839 n=1 Tax=Toxorhynchites rutilus septentrionalis TaxID=329112 RepID=UPI00247A2DAD|nr:uncharacterized protein LOC129764839 [Toxorhynchites rutilus septentrionalis]
MRNLTSFLNFLPSFKTEELNPPVELWKTVLSLYENDPQFRYGCLMLVFGVILIITVPSCWLYYASQAKRRRELENCILALELIAENRALHRQIVSFLEDQYPEPGTVNMLTNKKVETGE